MSELGLLEQLLTAAPEERSRAIARDRALLGEAEVNALAERARAAAQADPRESLRLAGIACDLANVLEGARGRALSLRAQGVALRALARWQDALEAFMAGARAAEEANDPLLAAQIPIAPT